MARFKNYLLVVIGFAVAGAIGAAFGTGTAQAVVSTLVSVVNPTSSPVPTHDVDNPARQPLNLQAGIDVLANAQNGFAQNIYQVPAGKRLIIEYIGLYTGVPNGKVPVMVSVSATTVSSTTSYAFAPVSNLPPYADAPTFHPVVASQPVYMFANPGDQISVGVATDGGSSAASIGTIQINGYLVNLP